MARAFDPGYGPEPFRSLVADVPGASVYPAGGALQHPADALRAWQSCHRRLSCLLRQNSTLMNVSDGPT